MKQFIIVLAIVLPGIVVAQSSESQKWENARYEMVNKGTTVYYTDINVDNETSAFSEKSFDEIKANMLQKEGVVKVEITHFNQTIRTYHYDFVDTQTIKDFVLEKRRDIEVMNRKVYTL
ncbi:MAG: hypothetical protein HWE22_12580 [Flavobacteriales bacterium]|nr:hypothetical protein [Flavobacteriales bacterium]